MPNVIQAYQMAIKPIVDSDAWGKATAAIQTKLNNIDPTTPSGKILQGVQNFAKTASGTIKTVMSIASAVVEALTMLKDASIEVSNKFVTAGSAYVDKGVLSTMAKYGMTNVQAQSMQATLEVTGYDINDIAIWTQAQKENYSNLMKIYQQGIDNIDTDKLEAFNMSTQNIQQKWDEFQLRLQTGLMKLLAESNLPDLLNDVADSFSIITDLLSSPLIQFGFDIITGLLDAITKFANWLGRGFNKIIGGGNTTNNTTNSTTTNNTNYNYTYSGGFDMVSFADSMRG